MNDNQKYHVAAGSYYSGKTEPKLLQAFLGTCVGAAVFDKTAGVGGIIHLLLPEPIYPDSVHQPEKYATTGIPIFLKSLIEAGATPGNMKAVFAGGALVGPVNHQDLNLDIGGRTAEKALEILKKEGIEIEKSETGGFFTCSLSLNMSTWKCEIEPAGFDRQDETQPVATPSLDNIHTAMEKIQPIPQVALKVLRLIGEGAYDIDKISEEVRKDQVITAKTLKLCNSAMFTKKKNVETLDHALVFLGQDLLVKLVISAAIESYFSQCTLGYSLCKGGIYHHAIGTAITAEKIAELTGRANPSIAYTAGLLHDIGKVVLDQYITGIYPLLYRELYKTGKDIISAEKKILKTDHTEIGGYLAEKWSFPKSLTDVIKHHHHPECLGSDNGLAATVYLADLLMSRFNTGLELEKMDTSALEPKLAALGISPEKLQEVVDLMPENVFNISMNEAGAGT